MTDMPDRKRQFDGLHNFRDFGGYAAGDRRMASGRFFRSAHHGMASDADLEKLAAMRIGAVIDLRRPDERERQPSKRWKDFQATLVENDDHFEGDESWAAFMASWDMTPESFKGFHIRYYTQAPYLPRLVDLYTRYFDVLGTSDQPIVVHCAAGKDRTGLIVALTQTLAGVHRDDIVADYLLTNDPARFAMFGPVWAEQIREARGRAPSPEAMQKAMSVEPLYLERSFAVIGERHGSIETYLRDVLGVDAGKRAAIEKRLFD